MHGAADRQGRPPRPHCCSGAAGHPTVVGEVSARRASHTEAGGPLDRWRRGPRRPTRCGSWWPRCTAPGSRGAVAPASSTGGQPIRAGGRREGGAGHETAGAGPARALPRTRQGTCAASRPTNLPRHGPWQPVVEVPAAFEQRCIPPGCVVRRLHMPNMRPPHALSGGRLAALGATRGSTTGCWGTAPRRRQGRPCTTNCGSVTQQRRPPVPGGLPRTSSRLIEAGGFRYVRATHTLGGAVAEPTLSRISGVTLTAADCRGRAGHRRARHPAIAPRGRGRCCARIGLTPVAIRRTC